MSTLSYLLKRQIAANPTVDYASVMKRIIILLLLFPLSVVAAETGYKIVHPDGTVEFTDDPNRGGEPIELKEAPTFKAPPVPVSKPAQQSQSDSKPKAVYDAIAITSPKRAQTLWFDGTGVSVSVQVTPGLKGGDKVVVTMDGKEVASGTQTQFVLGTVYRGEHKLTAKVVDAQGNTRIESEPVIFYMQRHTLNKP